MTVIYMKNKISWRRIQTVPTRQQNISGLLKPLIRAPRSNHLKCKFSAPSIQNVVKFLLIVTTMFTIKNEVCFLKICSQYAKRKINNTVRVVRLKSRLFGACLTPHYCVVHFASQLTVLPTP